MFTRSKQVITRLIVLAPNEYVSMKLPGVRGRREIHEIAVGYGFVEFRAMPYGLLEKLTKQKVEVDTSRSPSYVLESLLAEVASYLSQMPEPVAQEVFRCIRAMSPDNLRTEVHGPPAYY